MFIDYILFIAINIEQPLEGILIKYDIFLYVWRLIWVVIGAGDSKSALLTLDQSHGKIYCSWVPLAEYIVKLQETIIMFYIVKFTIKSLTFQHIFNKEMPCLFLSLSL